MHSHFPLQAVDRVRVEAKINSKISRIDNLDVLTLTYDFIKYENTFMKNKAYSISMSTFFQNTTG